MNQSLEKIFGWVAGGGRLSPSDALSLLEGATPLELGRAADDVRLEKHPGGEVTYIVDRNINYTNVCTTKCRFCAFSRDGSSGDAFVLDAAQIVEKVGETVDLGGTGILLQGGHNPSLPLSYYESVLKAVKSEFPKIHIHGFSPPEIAFFSKIFGKGIREMIELMAMWGLDSIPGGGAEILSDAVRWRMASNKATAGEWLSVMREAHLLGMRTTATMMFGSIEGPQDIVAHLDSLRRLQDETRGFTAFIPWTYQKGGEADLPDLSGTAVDYLKVLSLSRVYLDNFDNVQASWVTQGLEVGQVALHFGANDIGSVMIEENVVAAAGCKNKTNEPTLRTAIADAGFIPLKRRTLYEPAG